MVMLAVVCIEGGIGLGSQSELVLVVNGSIVAIVPIFTERALTYFIAAKNGRKYEK